MKRMLPVALSALLAGCVSVTATKNVDAPAATSPATEAKVAFDVTSGNPMVVMKTLETIELTRKQLIASGVTPHIVVGFRGEASYYTQTNLSMVKETDRADALKIAAAIRGLKKASGVESIEQCNIPLEPRKLKTADLMPEVKLVPNGWIALVGYQQRGYAYIAP